jgi:cytochrome c biogenesis protein CcmG/thiol:disulfide interchange protein DsbE
MSKKTIYKILIIAVLGVIGLYFYNKYNVAPSIQLTKLEVVDQNNAKFDFKSLIGKKVIVSFYASWCPNCIDELKTLNNIKAHKLSDIEILAITDESMEKLISFKDKKQYPFTFLKLNVPFSTIDIASIPTTYLLNTKGEIVYNKVGYIHWDDESNLNHLKSIME